MDFRKKRVVFSDPPSPAGKKAPSVSAAALLAALGILIYSNVFTSSFHFDDFSVIAANPAVRHPFDFAALWNAFNTRFLVGFSLALNYAFGKLNPSGYHVFNVCAHILAACAVYALADSLTKRPQAAFFAALLFLCHPLQTQPVAYVWQRAAVMAGAFYVGALVFYARFRRGGSRRSFAASLLCTVAAMFCKETAITLPFMLALYEFFFREGKESGFGKRAAPLFPFFLTLPIIPLTLMRAGHVTLNLMKPAAARLQDTFSLLDLTRFVGESEMPRGTYLLTQLDALKTYLRLLVLPVRQNLDYDYPFSTGLTASGTLLGLALLIGLLAAGIALYKRARLLSFAIFFFLIALSVESLIPQRVVLFEHRLYLPMAGACLFAVGAVDWLSKKIGRPGFFGIALTLLAGVFAVMTYQRNAVWKNELTLWNDVIAKSSNKPGPYLSRGLAYEVLGRYEEALADYQKATELKPDYIWAYNNAGNVYKILGRSEEALHNYGKAIEIQQGYGADYTDALNNRGLLYLELGRFEEALQDLNRAIDTAADYPQLYRTRAEIHHRAGRLEEAVKDYDQAVRLEPDDAISYNNRGVIQGERGLWEDALRDYNEAIRLDPRYAAAYNNRGTVYHAQGRFDQALKEYGRAIEIDPGYSNAVRNHANLLAGLGRDSAASGERPA